MRLTVESRVQQDRMKVVITDNGERILLGIGTKVTLWLPIKKGN